MSRHLYDPCRHGSTIARKKSIPLPFISVTAFYSEVGCFVMLIGPSYVGKSTLLAQMTLQLRHRTQLAFLPSLTPFARHDRFKPKIQKTNSSKWGIWSNRWACPLTTLPALIKIRGNPPLSAIFQDTGAIKEVERHAERFSPDLLCINHLSQAI